MHSTQHMISSLHAGLQYPTALVVWQQQWTAAVGVTKRRGISHRDNGSAAACLLLLKCFTQLS